MITAQGYPVLDSDGKEEQGLYPSMPSLKREEVKGMGDFRSFLYHKDYPGGKIFTDEVEFNMEIQRGAKEAPWLVNQVSAPQIPSDYSEDIVEPIAKPVIKEKTAVKKRKYTRKKVS